jgi:titin
VRTSFAEGYAAIDILTVYPEDAGVYTLRVANAAGEAFTSTTLHCIPTPQPQRQTSQYSESTLKLERQTSSTLTNTSAYVPQPQPQPLPQPTGPAQFPVFTQPLQDVRTKQGSAIHLETRLIPVGDSTLTVLWYKDGQPLQAGARFKTINDWGHVALDFLHSYPEDSGVYTYVKNDSYL